MRSFQRKFRKLQRSVVTSLVLLLCLGTAQANWYDFIEDTYGDYDIEINEWESFEDFDDFGSDDAVAAFYDALSAIYYEDSNDSDYAWNGYIPTATIYGSSGSSDTDSSQNDNSANDGFDTEEEDDDCNDPCLCYGDCDEEPSDSSNPPTTDNNPKPKENLWQRILNLFKKGSRLNANDQKKLEDAYKKMREECIYEYIDNYLQSQNVSLGSIYIADPGWMGQAAVTNSGDLKFADSNEITAEALKHEWFHLYQKEYHSLSSYTEPGMMEWEQAFFQDILMYIKIGGNRNGITYSWACFEIGNTSYEKDYLDWLSTLTNKGTTFPTNIDNSNFEHFADVFGDVSRSYNKSRGYNYSNTNYKPTAIQSIFAGAEKHCQ